MILKLLELLGAANTIDRVVDAFPENQQNQIRVQLSMVLRAVISQQLIPCEDDNTRPAFEIMNLNSAIQNMIRENKIHQIDSVIASGKEEGMVMMDNSIVEMVRAGQISRETAVMYASNKELMLKRLEKI